MKKSLPNIAVSAVVAMAIVMSVATVIHAASNLTCTGGVTGGEVQNVTVPRSKICVLNALTVLGSVFVGEGATLAVRDGTRIEGDVTANNCNAVLITNRGPNVADKVIIFGSVTITNCGGDQHIEASVLDHVAINGGIECSGNKGCFVNSTLVSGDLICDSNAGGCDLKRDTFGGSFECSDNSGLKGCVVSDNIISGNAILDHNLDDPPPGGIRITDTLFRQDLSCAVNSSVINGGGNLVTGISRGQCAHFAR